MLPFDGVLEFPMNGAFNKICYRKEWNWKDTALYYNNFQPSLYCFKVVNLVRIDFQKITELYKNMYSIENSMDVNEDIYQKSYFFDI